ncbi:MAG TPA: kelch repeat-containing protein [Gemmatimonadota bacterium]|nr:kelch repeat-containing protein [Gemmatimonadota bacterium]
MTPIQLLRLGGLVMLLTVCQPASPTTGQGGDAQVATMHVARAAHTATVLPSGEVLIVGGMDHGGGGLASVELFDPADNVVQELGSLAERRAGHTATPLADGRVLIAGGYSGEYLSSVEVFDPTRRRFQPAGSLLEGRSGHTATLLPDGRVLFVGGVGRGWSFLQSAELYDPEAGRSEAVGSMSVPRESHTATLLADGRVLIIGGHSGRRENMEVYASAEIFSPETRRFEPSGTLGIPRHKHDALRLADGRVLVIGGADHTDRLHYETTEIYDPRTATFEPGPSMANRRYKIAGTSVLLPSGDVLVTSGAEVAELLDLESWAFREVPDRFPTAYRFAASALLPGGDVVVMGGYSDDNRNTAGIWRFKGL